MGVTCSLSSATPAQVALLEKDPRLVDAFLAEPDEDAPAPTLMQRLFGGRPRIPPEILDTGGCMRTDLDKAWHGIHFLLTRSADPQPLPGGLLYGGGTELAGSSSLLEPAQVADCHRYLSALADDQVASAYDPQRMAELDIYPNIWVRDGSEALDYLIANLQTLRSILRDCVEEGHGLVITVE